MHLYRLKACSYQCEAAVLPPEHTAVAGLLLTAALRGHCFSETAAKSTFLGNRRRFKDSQLQMTVNLMSLLPAAGWCNQTSPLWGPSPSASGNCSQTEAVPSQTPWDPW